MGYVATGGAATFLSEFQYKTETGTGVTNILKVGVGIGMDVYQTESNLHMGSPINASSGNFPALQPGVNMKK